MALDMACSLGSPLSPFSAANIVSSNSVFPLFSYSNLFNGSTLSKQGRILPKIIILGSPLLLCLCWVMNRTRRVSFDFPPKIWTKKIKSFSLSFMREREMVSALNTIIFCLFMLACQTKAPLLLGHVTYHAALKARVQHASRTTRAPIKFQYQDCK